LKYLGSLKERGKKQPRDGGMAEKFQPRAVETVLGDFSSVWI